MRSVSSSTVTSHPFRASIQFILGMIDHVTNELRCIPGTLPGRTHHESSKFDNVAVVAQETSLNRTNEAAAAAAKRWKLNYERKANFFDEFQEHQESHRYPFSQKWGEYRPLPFCVLNGAKKVE